MEFGDCRPHTTSIALPPAQRKSVARARSLVFVSRYFAGCASTAVPPAARIQRTTSGNDAQPCRTSPALPAPRYLRKAARVSLTTPVFTRCSAKCGRLTGSPPAIRRTSSIMSGSPLDRSRRAMMWARSSRDRCCCRTPLHRVVHAGSILSPTMCTPMLRQDVESSIPGIRRACARRLPMRSNAASVS